MERPTKDMQTQSFQDIQWLSAFGINKLSALDYFYTSPFFDQSSNNQRIRVQGVEAEKRNDILKSMIGLEFMLDEALTCEPNIYVIRKQIRKGPLSTDLVDIYYIADGFVFKSPEFLALVKSRLNKASFYLTNAFQKIHSTVKYSKGNTGIASTNGTFTCWNREGFGTMEGATREDDGDTLGDGASSSRSSNNESKKRKREICGAVLREFPSFKSVILDTTEPTFVGKVTAGK